MHKNVYYFQIIFLLGYTLNRVFDDLLQFDLVTSLWSVIQPGTPQPVCTDFYIFSMRKNSLLVPARF